MLHRGWCNESNRHRLSSYGAKTRKSYSLRIKTPGIIYPTNLSNDSYDVSKYIAQWGLSDEITLLHPSMTSIIALENGLLSERETAELMVYLSLLIDRLKSSQSIIHHSISKKIKQKLHDKETALLERGHIDFNQFSSDDVLSYLWGEYTILRLIEALPLDATGKKVFKKTIKKALYDGALIDYLSEGQKSLYDMYKNVVNNVDSIKGLPDVPSMFVWMQNIEMFKKKMVSYYTSEVLHVSRNQPTELDIFPLRLSIFDLKKYKDLYNLDDTEANSLIKGFIEGLTNVIDTSDNSDDSYREYYVSLPLIYIAMGKEINMDNMTSDFSKIASADKNKLSIYSRTILIDKYMKMQLSIIDFLLLFSNKRIMENERDIMEWVYFTPASFIGIPPSKPSEVFDYTIKSVWSLLKDKPTNVKYDPNRDEKDEDIYKQMFKFIEGNRTALYEIYQLLKRGDTYNASERLTALFEKSNLKLWTKPLMPEIIEPILKETAIYKTHNETSSPDPIVIYSSMPDKLTPQEKLLATSVKVLENEYMGVYNHRR